MRRASVCNPLKYKSFPYNPSTCKPWHIFHTFLSHQHEIILSSLTDTWIFRSAYHTFSASVPKNSSLSLFLCEDPLCRCYPFPTEELQAAVPDGCWILEQRKSWLVRSQRSFPVSSVRLDFQCSARKTVSPCAVLPKFAEQLLWALVN